MQTILLQILGSVLRALLGSVFLWMVKEGWITEGQIPELVTALATGVVTLGWIIWAKVRQNRVVQTALTTKPGKTLADVEDLVASGHYAPATTPKDAVPAITPARVEAGVD